MTQLFEFIGTHPYWTAFVLILFCATILTGLNQFVIIVRGYPPEYLKDKNKHDNDKTWNVN
jgi:hypothetical protein